MCTSLDSGGGQVYKLLKGGQQPDTMTSALFSSITTDPGQVLEEKLAEWRKIWKCDDDTQRDKACRAIRAALADARMAGDFDGGATHVHTGGQIAAGAKSFKRTTSIGAIIGHSTSLRECYRQISTDWASIWQSGEARASNLCNFCST